ncbi:hypothetical protein [Actinospica sp.]|uniref:hypothetical protein n=1 Tax=Actinospica sp. TaxID=1872142 RepID=UPI002B84E0D2|nr:hypothetical protein [Actinospica sp.]HWG23007.1 hypothetical protein [Actinospica sp.]
MSESTPAASVAAKDDDQALAARRLRDFSFAQVILLVLQTVLGMRVNLFVQVPAGDQGKGLLSSFGNAMSKGPAEIAAHSGFGLLVFINACLLVVFSLTVRGISIKLASVLGWLAIAGAAVSGASFVNATASSSSANDASFAMALLTMVAVACYAWNLFALFGEKAAAGTEAEAAETAAGAEAEGETTAEAAEAQTATEAETEAEVTPEPEAAAETEAGAETKAEAETAEAEAETKAEPEAATEAEPDTKAEQA